MGTRDLRKVNSTRRVEKRLHPKRLPRKRRPPQRTIQNRARQPRPPRRPRRPHRQKVQKHLNPRRLRRSKKQRRRSRKNPRSLLQHLRHQQLLLQSHQPNHAQIARKSHRLVSLLGHRRLRLVVAQQRRRNQSVVVASRVTMTRFSPTKCRRTMNSSCVCVCDAEKFVCASSHQQLFQL